MSRNSFDGEEFIPDSLSEHVEHDDCAEFNIQRYSIADTVIEMDRSSHIFKPNPLVLCKGRTCPVSETGMNNVSRGTMLTRTIIRLSFAHVIRAILHRIEVLI